MPGTPLQYQPFSSLVDPSFWHLLMQKKIQEYRLSSEPRKVHGYFSVGE